MPTVGSCLGESSGSLTERYGFVVKGDFTTLWRN
jgi:hypothetical protein